YDVWQVEKVELAILAELLLRGPQTEGEVRGRADRMEAIADLDTLRTLLKPLVQRGLVVYLTPEGKRGTIVTHGFHSPQESQKLRAHHTSVVSQQDAETPRTPAPDRTRIASHDDAVRQLAEKLQGAREEIAALRGTLTAAQTDLANL